MVRLILILLVVPGVLLAETPLSLSQFKAVAEGKTLYFATPSGPYGAEQYLKGQRSIWRYGDGSCTHGVWYAKKDMICFRYEDETTEQCWRIFDGPGGLVARADGAGPGDGLRVVKRSPAPLICKGPDVGV